MNVLERFRTVPDKDLERSKLELANSYRQIQGTMAYKHMMDELDRIYVESYKLEDQCDIKELGLALAGQARGMRKAIDDLRRKIKNAVSE